MTPLFKLLILGAAILIIVSVVRSLSGKKDILALGRVNDRKRLSEVEKVRHIKYLKELLAALSIYIVSMAMPIAFFFLESKFHVFSDHALLFSFFVVALALVELGVAIKFFHFHLLGKIVGASVAFFAIFLFLVPLFSGSKNQGGQIVSIFLLSIYLPLCLLRSVLKRNVMGWRLYL